jgi:hypothetical protein
MFLIYFILMLLSSRFFRYEAFKKSFHKKLFWDYSYFIFSSQFTPLLLSVFINLADLRYDSSLNKISSYLTLGCLPLLMIVVISLTIAVVKNT